MMSQRVTYGESAWLPQPGAGSTYCILTPRVDEDPWFRKVASQSNEKDGQDQPHGDDYPDSKCQPLMVRARRQSGEKESH